jgi:hypothetical protein
MNISTNRGNSRILELRAPRSGDLSSGIGALTFGDDRSSPYNAQLQAFGVSFFQAKCRPGHNLGHNYADSHTKSPFEQAVKFFAFDREVGQAKSEADHDLGQKNRAHCQFPFCPWAPWYQ